VSLISVEELRIRMQRDIDEATAQQACDLATGQVQSLTRQTLERAEHVEACTLSGRWDGSRWTVATRLRQRPVVTVDTVDVDGVELDPAGWGWDAATGWLTVNDTAVTSCTVTYTAGYDPIPADLKAVALDLAVADVANPAGVASERLGDYSVQFADRSKENRMKAILGRYTPQAGTVRVG
jgi:hypothetical protein